MTDQWLPILGTFFVVGVLLFILRPTRSDSYRSEAGVKIVRTVTPHGVSHRVDMDDPQTKELFRREMEKWAQYEIHEGKLRQKP